MSGSSNPTVTQTNTTALNPQQTALYNQAFPYASQYASTPMQSYSGPTVAGFTPNQTQAQQGALTAAAGPGQQIAGQAAGAESALTNPNLLDIAHNPTFTGAASGIQSMSNQNLLQNILPAIKSGATIDAGQYSGGGTRAGVAEGVAAGNAQTGVSNAVEQLAQQMYGQGLGAMATGVQNAPTAQGAQLFGPGVQAGVGGAEQGLTQEQMNAAMTNFYASQQMPFMQASNIMSLLGAMPGGTGIGTSTGATPGVSPLSMGLGGASALGAMTPFLKMMGLGGSTAAGTGAAGGAAADAGATAASSGGGFSLASLFPFLFAA